MSGFALRGFIALLAVGSCAAAALGAEKADKPTGKAGGEKKEADAYAAYRGIFKRLDADGDGSVTEAEYLSRTRWPEAKARAIWRASDADASGGVNIPEYLDARWRWQVDIRGGRRTRARSSITRTRAAGTSYTWTA